ncbi:MAG: hypothetical protein M3R58_10730 [Pseudomonadota bacterium]|nr:hypothetical protein [Pseudomonadota bacterium]
MSVIRDDRCTFAFNRIAPGALEIVIDGIDTGQFGTAPLDEISMALVRERPLELFVDATRASMPAVTVSKEWTRYFALNQKDLVRVSVRTGKLIQIYSDSELYEARKTAAARR